MDYRVPDELKNYIGLELHKASVYLDQNPSVYTPDIADDCVRLVEELRGDIDNWGMHHFLNDAEARDFAISQRVLYGRDYARSYTFCCEFWLIDTLGKYDGWKNLKEYDFVPESILDQISR